MNLGSSTKTHVQRLLHCVSLQAAIVALAWVWRERTWRNVLLEKCRHSSLQMIPHGPERLALLHYRMYTGTTDTGFIIPIYLESLMISQTCLPVVTLTTLNDGKQPDIKSKAVDTAPQRDENTEHNQRCSPLKIMCRSTWCTMQSWGK